MRRRFRQKYGLKVKGVMGLLRSDSLCVQPSLTTPCGETSTSVESKSVKIQGLDIQSSISQPSELTHVSASSEKRTFVREDPRLIARAHLGRA